MVLVTFIYMEAYHPSESFFASLYLSRKRSCSFFDTRTPSPFSNHVRQWRSALHLQEISFPTHKKEKKQRASKGRGKLREGRQRGKKGCRTFHMYERRHDESLSPLSPALHFSLFVTAITLPIFLLASFLPLSPHKPRERERCCPHRRASGPSLPTFLRVVCSAAQRPADGHRC